MRDNGNYIGRHDGEHASSTSAGRLSDGAGRHYQPRRLAPSELDSQPRLAELSVTRHQPRHAA